MYPRSNNALRSQDNIAKWELSTVITLDGPFHTAEFLPIIWLCHYYKLYTIKPERYSGNLWNIME